MKNILLAHGGGGEETGELINKLFFKYFSNEILLAQEDAATLHVKSDIAFTTDSFTVSPLFFEGGNIGKLAIAGTVNDLAMAGAKPLYLSASFIIEEGFLYSDLEKIVKTMRDEMEKSGVKIVTGDTKVVPKGSCDGIFINTSGVGQIICKNLSANTLKDGYKIIVSNEVGNHGSCILATREELNLHSNLKSDCASLWGVVDEIFAANIKPKALRDATRGGLSAVLNEWARASNVCISVDEDKIPVAKEVNGICEFLGFEPYELANEGTFIVCVEEKDVDKTLEVLHKNPLTCKASCIGEVKGEHKQKVILNTPWKSQRFLEPPRGELLPRIC